MNELDQQSRLRARISIMTHDQRRQRRVAIAQEIQRGQTIAETAIKYGVSEATVRASMYECGVQKAIRQRPSGGPLHRPGDPAQSDRHYQIVARILNTNESYAQIAKAVGITHQGVSYIAVKLKEHGIKFPPRPKGGS